MKTKSLIALVFIGSTLSVPSFATNHPAPVPPRVTTKNARPGVKRDNATARNQYRQQIVNSVIRQRGTPETISATVYSLSFFEPFFMFWNKWETTFGMINRGIYANMPFGQKKHYSGLHPRYVEYRLRDPAGDLLYAQCLLDVYTSRAIPGRVFVRSHRCIEQDYARAAGQKGFAYAVVADLNGTKIVNFKDLTEDWVKDNELDSETRFVNYLTDRALFTTSGRVDDYDASAN